MKFLFGGNTREDMGLNDGHTCNYLEDDILANLRCNNDTPSFARGVN